MSEDVFTLEIDGWKNDIRFSSSHLLAHHNKCSRLHGHTYVIRIKIVGKLNKNFMVADFGPLKDSLKLISAELDHKLLLPEKSENMKIKLNNNKVIVDNGGKVYVIPREDVVLLPLTATTAEKLSDYFLKKLLHVHPMPKEVREVYLAVDEGWGQGAWSVWKREQ